MPDNAVSTNNFEQSLGELEQRVVRLEHGELDLDEALRLFEEGVTLVRQCQEILDHAEARVTTLSGATEPGRSPFGNDG